jgi:signal transduction histidine kinase
VRDVVRDLTEGDKSAARPENRVLTRSGEERLIAWSNVCLFDEQGRVTGHLSSGQDVTQQRAAESQARQSQKLESIGTLASGVAHEINNPINGVMNYAQLIKDRAGNGGAGLEEFADEIIKDANRVARIVRNLLAFARREKGTRAPAGMKEIVEDAISLTGAALRRDQIKVSMNIPEELPDLMCHAQQLEQVAVNLLMNARDALNSKYYGGDEQKTITVAVIPVEKEWVEGKSDGKAGVRLTVEDHGTGISESVRARMFDPFFTTKPRGKGTGLGLSILHGIVEEHGGRISVESEEGEWTRFHVDLPL